MALRIRQLSQESFQPPLTRDQEYLLGLIRKLGEEASFFLAEEFRTTPEAVEASLYEEDRSEVGQRIRQGILVDERLQRYWEGVGMAIEAREILTVANLDLVKYAVYKLGYGKGPFEERERAGILGLIEAAKRYDPSEEVRFSTYALFWIRQAMERYSLGEGAYVPAWAFRSDRAEIREAVEKAQKVLSLDAPLEEESKSTLGDLLPSSYPLPEERALERVMVERVRQALLEGLTPRQRLIVEKRYGLDGNEPASFVDIAAELGVSHQAVHQTEKIALRKLRESLEALSL